MTTECKYEEAIFVETDSRSAYLLLCRGKAFSSLPTRRDSQNMFGFIVESIHNYRMAQRRVRVMNFCDVCFARLRQSARTPSWIVPARVTAVPAKGAAGPHLPRGGERGALVRREGDAPDAG